MPVKPSEAKALIPSADEPICPKIVRLFIQMPILLWRIVSDIWNEDGTVTEEFKASIGLTVGGLAAPTNVSATDGEGSSVTITWSPVTGASSYKVFRGTTNDSSAATQIGSPSDTTIEDTSATSGQVYWYFVKATNAGGDSNFSTGDSGYWGATAGTPIHYNDTQDVIVPAGWSTIAVDIYGGGGGGGGQWPGFTVGTFYGGGGGGGGEKRSVTGITVTTGETLNLIVGDPGNKGGIGSNGNNGLDSAFIRQSTSEQIALASGGNGGGKGGNSPGAAGAGGTGGSGGTGTDGNNGNPGTVNQGGDGANGLDGYGAGGNGAGLSDGTIGSKGKIIITPNG